MEHSSYPGAFTPFPKDSLGLSRPGVEGVEGSGFGPIPELRGSEFMYNVLSLIERDVW